MERALRDALQELYERTASYWSRDSQQVLRRGVTPSPGNVLTANDIDSAVVRWADAVGLDAVPAEVDAAAEHVVRTLNSTAALHL